MQVRAKLIQLRDELCVLRQQLADAKAITGAIEQSEPFVAKKIASDLASGADADVRREALALYLETNDANLVDGITVKQVTVVDYDPEAAYRWALEELITKILGLYAKRRPPSKIVDELCRGATFLVLDEKAFVASVKGGTKGLPAKLGSAPQINIARDLSKFLDSDDDL